MSVTEPAFTGIYWDHVDDGVYECVHCEEPLFDSRDKVDAGTGWPTFLAPVSVRAVSESRGGSSGTPSALVSCGACGACLGQLLTDGADGPRYSINSASLDFAKRSA